MLSGRNEPPLADLLTSYAELNPSYVEELSQEPSPLEFMRYVSRNTPFVIRGGASDWQAVGRWDVAYLKKAMAGRTVNVAVTPDGNADAPLYSPAHKATVLAKPLEEDYPFDEFVSYLIRQETGSSLQGESEVRYAQTPSENDNMRDEYFPLCVDIQQDIPFARIGLGREPDAINMWIGNSRSTTALHRDPMENVYVQIRGKKHFSLLSPVYQPCVNESRIPPATYARRDGQLLLRLDPDSESVPFPTWDPDIPNSNTNALSAHAGTLQVTLNPGDMLYLPAMWYHKVAQSCGDEIDDKFVVAINYWYDMDFTGLLYPFTTFLRAIAVGDDSPQD